MVPNVGAEKAKGAILSRSVCDTVRFYVETYSNICAKVQYIHDLKENEARNIEKWTLEKLLMDQAMGDLQVRLARRSTRDSHPSHSSLCILLLGSVR